MPSFHGIEPSVALTYNSSGGNSTVGVGWALTGFSYIERQGTDGGSPQYDSTDSYRLGGSDLRVCGASASPGCLAGGTHFTEHENYQRITFDGSLTWTVDQQNGTTRTYTPVFSVGSDTFRWGLSEVEDTVGNTVTYNWWCDGTDDCYPDNVTYNGYRVKIYYRNDRTDIRSFATGASLAETAQLVRTIKVELTDGTPIRAYALSHSTSGSTNRTRLDSVQMYGNDVVVDVDGIISGGSSLPAETFTYMTDPNDDEFTDGSAWMGACTGNNHAGTGDFNGDGLQDYYCHDEWGGDLDIGYSTGTTFAVSSWTNVCGGLNDWMSTGDFDGDGKTDFRCTKQNGNEHIGLSTGTDFTWSTWIGDWCNGNKILGDFNGDGKTDLSCRNNSNYGVKVLLSDGTSFSSSGTWLTNWCRDDGASSHGENWGADAKVILPGDFNGDGNLDLLCRGTSGGGRGPWIALSDGSAFTHDGKWTDVDQPCGGADLRGVGDFNADGKSDIYCYDNASGGGGKNWDTQIGLSDGSDFHIGQWLGANTCDSLNFTDVNGDGLTDVWCHKDAGSAEWVGLGDGHSQFANWQMWRNNWCDTKKMMPGDFNGDGKTDLVCKDSSDSMVALSGGIVNKTDLLIEIVSSIGGTTTINYAPGTQWANTSVEPPASLSINDGSGNTSTSPSTHRRTPGAPTVTSMTDAAGRRRRRMSMQERSTTRTSGASWDSATSSPRTPR